MNDTFKIVMAMVASAALTGVVMAAKRKNDEELEEKKRDAEDLNGCDWCPCDDEYYSDEDGDFYCCHSCDDHTMEFHCATVVPVR